MRQKSLFVQAAKHVSQVLMPDNLNSSFSHQFFAVPKAHGESEMEPDRSMGEFRRKTVAAMADFLHRTGPPKQCGELKACWT